MDAERRTAEFAVQPPKRVRAGNFWYKLDSGEFGRNFVAN
jgi:hypothetical protein